MIVHSEQALAKDVPGDEMVNVLVPIEILDRHRDHFIQFKINRVTWTMWCLTCGEPWAGFKLWRGKYLPDESTSELKV